MAETKKDAPVARRGWGAERRDGARAVRCAARPVLGTRPPVLVQERLAPPGRRLLPLAQHARVAPQLQAGEQLGIGGFAADGVQLMAQGLVVGVELGPLLDELFPRLPPLPHTDIRVADRRGPARDLAAVGLDVEGRDAGQPPARARPRAARRQAEGTYRRSSSASGCPASKASSMPCRCAAASTMSM